MTRRNQRLLRLHAPQRDDLLRKVEALWTAVCRNMRFLTTSGSDYRAASALSQALGAFANEISDGATDFARMQATNGGGRAQRWEKLDPDIEVSIDEALAICNGDPRAVIRSLLVMTEFLEAEAEKFR